MRTSGKSHKRYKAREEERDFIHSAKSGIYSRGNEVLFVPSPDMWLAHEKSTPDAIFQRAGLAPLSWKNLKKKYAWILEWLYGDEPERLPPDFRPTRTLLSARNEATKSAIAEACQRPGKRIRGRRGRRVSADLISHWQDKYKDYPWIGRWLLRGEKAPANVKVVTALEADRHAKAWDYISHCMMAGFSFRDTYLVWLNTKLVPIDPELEWLKWLFGGPDPRGSFIVGPELRRLRTETTKTRILEVAGICGSKFEQWQGKSILKKALQEAIEAANAPGRLDLKNPWSQVTAKIHGRIRRTMLKYAVAQTLKARCERVDMSAVEDELGGRMSIPRYFNLLRRAEDRGVKKELELYLNSQTPYQATKSNKSGLVAKNLFIPSPAMLKFRKVADQAMSQQHILWSGNHPAFDLWFVDWATPARNNGRRIADAFLADAAAKVLTPMTSDESPVTKKERRGRPAGTVDPEVQRRIRKMLKSWDQGLFKSKAAAARGFGFHRSDASKWIRMHERRNNSR